MGSITPDCIIIEPNATNEDTQMLTHYINAAMHQATYELLEDATFYAEIPEFQGVYANAETLEACREQLQEVLEG